MWCFPSISHFARNVLSFCFCLYLWHLQATTWLTLSILLNSLKSWIKFYCLHESLVRESLNVKINRKRIQGIKEYTFYLSWRSKNVHERWTFLCGGHPHWLTVWKSKWVRTVSSAMLLCSKSGMNIKLYGSNYFPFPVCSGQESTLVTRSSFYININYWPRRR